MSAPTPNRVRLCETCGEWTTALTCLPCRQPAGTPAGAMVRLQGKPCGCLPGEDCGCSRRVESHPIAAQDIVMGVGTYGAGRGRVR